MALFPTIRTGAVVSLPIEEFNAAQRLVPPPAFLLIDGEFACARVVPPAHGRFPMYRKSSTGSRSARAGATPLKKSRLSTVENQGIGLAEDATVRDGDSLEAHAQTAGERIGER